MSFQTQSVPLTPVQEAMVAASSKRPWLYLEQIVCHLGHECLSPGILAAAFQKLVEQSPILRLEIQSNGAARSTQRIAVSHDVAVETLDWAHVSPDEIRQQFRAFLKSDRAKGCPLDAAPCFRLTLIRTGPTSSILVWSFPHALLDGRSFAPLLAQAFINYEAIEAGRPSPVTPEVADSIFLQHCTAVDALNHASGETYFAQTLEGWEGDTGLIVPRQEPSRKETLTQQLSMRETKALVSLANATDVTLSTVVSAAWGIVLARFTGRADAVFGMTLSGRHLLEKTESALGCFIVTVPFRVQLGQELSIGALLRSVRKGQLDLRPFEHTPLAGLRRFTNVPLDKPLLESSLMFERASLDVRMQGYGAKWQHRRVELYEEDDFPLTVAAYQDEALRIEVEYDAKQVPQASRLAHYLKNLLCELAASAPTTQLAQLSMLDDDERQHLELLSSVTDTTPSEHCCITAFERQAARWPRRTALKRIGGGKLTYGELDAAANALAQRLIDRGVTQGDAVGICASRSPAFVVAILAIWKAGAAFVPMDPTYPKTTLNIMAQDSGAKIILTDADAPLFNLATLALSYDQLQERQARAPDRNHMSENRNAYIIFTSGSTGRPKGVVVSQTSLAAHAAAVTKLFDLSSEDQVLQFASLSFDVAIEEIIPTLLSGATLLLRSPKMSQSVSAFLQVCETHRITLLNLPTGFWVELTLFLETHNSLVPPDLRMVIVGGERVPLSILRRWRDIAPKVRWINGYGPTETTITCTAYELTDDRPLRHSVPIGRPLAHARAWVLAADGSFAPIGAPGELCIAGPAVAEGYVIDEGAKRIGFHKDTSAGRSYRTGDRVYWQDGLLNFIGRMDRQLKVRGFRIDPNQVESLLEERHDVARAYVAVADNKNGRLVAWYSAARATAPPLLQDIQADLSQKLPPYMMPELSYVETWPRTPGGKIDVAALPFPQDVVQSLEPQFKTDSSHTRRIAELFEAVLETSPVAADSSFFNLGGNSLSILRLNTLLEKAFDTRIDPSLFYQDPSPAGIAKLITTKTEDRSCVIPLQPKGGRAPLYAIHALGENNSFFLPLAGALNPNQPLFGITIGIRKEGMPSTVEALAAFYVEQIKHHRPAGPVSLVAVSVSSFITFEVAQQLLAAGRDVQALIFLDASGPDGRIRKGRLGHRWVHFKNLLKQGKPYLDKLKQERRGERLHAEEMARLKESGPEVAPACDEARSVAQFVALSELAISNYLPSPYPRRITIFKADDPFDAKAVFANGLGWKSVAKAGFDMIQVKGGHITMLYPPHVEELAQHITKALCAPR
ncbi:amino acid adenylation domain-containing protein [Sulfitobacter sp. 1A10445]|uniref:non-ribosomal peptide synthetase n=1 Tax=unclassified Sulfitobacter TaxID=196795 RepID=UPI0037457D39